jgi:hypothetical protein
MALTALISCSPSASGGYALARGEHHPPTRACLTAVGGGGWRLMTWTRAPPHGEAGKMSYGRGWCLRARARVVSMALLEVVSLAVGDSVSSIRRMWTRHDGRSAEG